MAKNIVWMFEANKDKWTPYFSEHQPVIETAFLEEQKDVTLNTLGQTVVVYPGDMIQVCQWKSSKIARVVDLQGTITVVSEKMHEQDQAWSSKD